MEYFLRIQTWKVSHVLLIFPPFPNIYSCASTPLSPLSPQPRLIKWFSMDMLQGLPHQIHCKYGCMTEFPEYSGIRSLSWSPVIVMYTLPLPMSLFVSNVLPSSPTMPPSQIHPTFMASPISHPFEGASPAGFQLDIIFTPLHSGALHPVNLPLPRPAHGLPAWFNLLEENNVLCLIL